NSKLSKSLEKLSSGYAINRAGDNAAGLAVSEKMRSQIAGLTQGVKNAQDGISMIQTYEGALTETDSILQRMKTLADQAANGTYQDEVDRDAIQLEFNQLNDELNQIADTDFNGVVTLNGGVMADGTKAVNGKFDYANGTRDAKQLGNSDITKLDYQVINDLDTTDGKTKADTAWSDLFGSDRTDNLSTNDGPDSFEVTLQYDAANNAWAVTKATNGAKLSELQDASSVTTTENGGFTLKTKTGGVELANVVLERSTLINGDTITLKVSNPSNKTSAPSNAGANIIDQSGFKSTAVAGTITAGTAVAGDGATGVAATTDNGLNINDANLVIDVNKDTVMTEDINDMFELLNGATVSANYTSKKTAKGDMTLTFANPDFAAITNKADSTLTVGNTTFKVKTDVDGITIQSADGNTSYARISMVQQTADGTTAKPNSTGTIKYSIQIDDNKFSASSGPEVSVVDDKSKVSVSNSNNYASAPLTYTDHVVLQTGARTKDSVDFTFNYSSNGLGDLKANMNCSARADGLGTANLSLLTQQDANFAIDRIDNAINKVSMVRATFGAVQNRLEHKIDNMNVTIENITSAESGIRDTNMPTEMMNFTKQQILSQASQSMLAQANQLPQSVLSLLQ
ncbi:MAG: hypothetical protein K2K44_01630, partial [Oscillospiraceae bacterium]|nr:hypothetical protein [Oscillospiraceae bacterium]